MADASASIVAALRENSDLLRSTDSLTDIDTHTLDHEGGGSDAFSRKASTEEIATSSKRIKCSILDNIQNLDRKKHVNKNIYY